MAQCPWDLSAAQLHKRATRGPAGNWMCFLPAKAWAAWLKALTRVWSDGFGILVFVVVELILMFVSE